MRIVQSIHLRPAALAVCAALALASCSKGPEGQARMLPRPAVTPATAAAFASSASMAQLPCIGNATAHPVQFEAAAGRDGGAWRRYLLQRGDRLRIPAPISEMRVRFASVPLSTPPDPLPPGNRVGVAAYRIRLDHATRPGRPRRGECLHEFGLRPNGMLDLFLRTGMLAGTR